MLNAKQQTRLETLGLESELSKKQVREFLNQLVSTGSFTEQDASDARRILSDKTMCAEDALDEIRSMANILDDAAKSDLQKTGETEQQNETSNEDETTEDVPAPGSSMLAGLVSQITDPKDNTPESKPEPKATPEKTGKTIEPNREEQNGLKRPSKGSTCALIWDTCDRITSEQGSHCTSAQLFAAQNGLNECTLRTQYARWRQFHGITGRLAGQVHVAKVPAEFADVIENLQARVSNETALVTLAEVKTSDELVVWLSKNFINF